MSKPRVVTPSRVGPPKPPERPFEHDARCRMRDATPEWIDAGGGLWTRECRCTSEQWRAPNVRAPEPVPDVAAHRHSPGCDGRAKVVEYPDGGRYTRCAECATSTHTLRLPVDRFDREDYLAGLVV